MNIAEKTQAAASQEDLETRLTDAEKALVDRINADPARTRDSVRAELEGALQCAVEIELATIPIYLYTYYSIDRGGKIKGGPDTADINKFANRTGGVIMSVAIEEMLHMSLASNIFFAFTGRPPALFGRAPASYPTKLAFKDTVNGHDYDHFHNPEVPAGPDGETDLAIPLAPFSYEQLWQFLLIEYPEPADAPAQGDNWRTIGQYYSYIRCLIASDHITDRDFQNGAVPYQIQAKYYAPNNTDTIHPTQAFDGNKPAPAPKTSGADVAVMQTKSLPTAAEVVAYPNAADSFAVDKTRDKPPHPLITIACKNDAFTAIETIGDQGEGTPITRKAAGDDAESIYDDKARKEYSHYYKFLTLQSHLDQYHRDDLHEKLPDYVDIPETPKNQYNIEYLISSGKIKEFIKNPRYIDYKIGNLVLLAFGYILFEYMLLMTETLFLKKGKKQEDLFNTGLHRSMMWVMDTYFAAIGNIHNGKDGISGKPLVPMFTPFGKEILKILNINGKILKVNLHNILKNSGFLAKERANYFISRNKDYEKIEDEYLRAKKKSVHDAAESLVDAIDTALTKTVPVYCFDKASKKTICDDKSMHLPNVSKDW